MERVKWLGDWARAGVRRARRRSGRRRGRIGSSPETAYSEDVETFVAAQHWDVAADSLGGQHAVEWVAVCPGQTSGTKCVVGSDGHEGITGREYGWHEGLLEMLRSWKLAEADLGGDLPSRGGGNEQIIAGVGDEPRNRFAERLGREHRPKQRVSIEQQCQRSPSSSSGSGSKKEALSLKPGVSSAPSRFCLGAAMGSSFATGVFLRPEVMTTVSPFWARFTSADRCVLASKTVASIWVAILLT